MLVLVLLVTLSGCANTLSQKDVEQAFDNSLQRYAIYNAKQIGYEVALALTGLSIIGQIVLCEPSRPISDSVLAEATYSGTLQAQLLLGKLKPPVLPPSCNFVATGHSTFYYCVYTALATLIFSGVSLGIYKCIQAIRRVKSVVC